jgi:hypothetical protein
MNEPKSKGKKSSEINIYRERCRNFVASHPKLHPNHKVIIMRMTDYVNRHSYEAFVGEEKLAADCNTTPRSVRRAKNAAKRLGIIECTLRGNTNRASRHIFRVELQDTSQFSIPATTGHLEPDYRTLSVDLQDTGVPRTSEITPESTSEILAAPPSSSAPDGHSSVVAPENSNGANSANAVPSGARSATQEKESGEQERARPRQSREAFHAEMAARGLDMSQSRWGVDRPVREGPK